MAFEQVMQILILVAVVLVFWWSHRSFPPQQTAELLQRLTEASEQTQTRLDDLLVTIAKLLHEQLPDAESAGEERSEW